MNYAVEQRIRLIDFLLCHYGSVGREQISEYFGVSDATVTRDFRKYQELVPGNALLNQSSKRWVRSDTFVAVYK